MRCKKPTAISDKETNVKERMRRSRSHRAMRSIKKAKLNCRSVQRLRITTWPIKSLSSVFLQAVPGLKGRARLMAPDISTSYLQRRDYVACVEGFDMTVDRLQVTRCNGRCAAVVQRTVAQLLFELELKEKGQQAKNSAKNSSEKTPHVY